MFWPGRSSLEPPGAPDRVPMSTAHVRGSCAAPGGPARHQEAHGVPCLCRWTSPDRPVGQAPNPRRRSRTGPAHLDPGRRQAMIWSSGMVSCPHNVRTAPGRTSGTCCRSAARVRRAGTCASGAPGGLQGGNPTRPDLQTLTVLPGSHGSRMSRRTRPGVGSAESGAGEWGLSGIIRVSPDIPGRPWGRLGPPLGGPPGLPTAVATQPVSCTN